MTDLLSWYLAQLDADERIARAATSGSWEWNGDDWAIDHGIAFLYAGDDVVIGAEGQVTISVPDARHVALHDPAAVLADIASKRAILERHAPETPVYEPQPDPFGRLVCRTCGTQDGWHDVSWPCDTARHLVSAFRSREGYDPAWSPT